MTNAELDPLIRPLPLSALEQAELVAFLEGLTRLEVEPLVTDAPVAPIGDVGGEKTRPGTQAGRS